MLTPGAEGYALVSWLMQWSCGSCGETSDPWLVPAVTRWASPMDEHGTFDTDYAGTFKLDQYRNTYSLLGPMVMCVDWHAPEFYETGGFNFVSPGSTVPWYNYTDDMPVLMPVVNLLPISGDLYLKWWKALEKGWAQWSLGLDNWGLCEICNEEPDPEYEHDTCVVAKFWWEHRKTCSEDDCDGDEVMEQAHDLAHECECDWHVAANLNRAFATSYGPTFDDDLANDDTFQRAWSLLAARSTAGWLHTIKIPGHNQRLGLEREETHWATCFSWRFSPLVGFGSIPVSAKEHVTPPDADWLASLQRPPL